ncbi:hypothetical protein BY996DRAFT_6414253 [Phakopsora pachyrhizi]|nr:hypothetical protein BY996DRAFT_6414253 [Phakopsora pachyrhizi]
MLHLIGNIYRVGGAFHTKKEGGDMVMICNLNSLFERQKIRKLFRINYKFIFSSGLNEDDFSKLISYATIFFSSSLNTSSKNNYLEATIGKFNECFGHNTFLSCPEQIPSITGTAYIKRNHGDILEVVDSLVMKLYFSSSKGLIIIVYDELANTCYNRKHKWN